MQKNEIYDVTFKCPFNCIMSVRPDREAKRPGQTKVSKLDAAVSVDQQILRFQVPEHQH